MPLTQPKPGDYIVLPISGESGRLISIGEWLNGDGFANYDHAEIYVGLADSKCPYGYTMGAYPHGANLRPLPSAAGTQEGWLWSSGVIPLTGEQRQKIVNSALACKGIPYSSADYFELAAHRLKIPAPGLKRAISDSGHMICSQLVDHCYLRGGVHLFKDNRWPGYVTPADLANLILAA